VRVIERIEGCYETQVAPFGKVYVWRPERFVVECSCGERSTLVGTMTACGCGADLVATLRETPSARRPREGLHPWRYAGDRKVVEYLTGRIS
jgi:hypothetical protein